ncbi:MAG: MFS transporter [Pandoraea sp.]|nr:MFS transporter [Pandoraea sp.]
MSHPTLSVSRFWFPFSLVLFEFAVYISNDMIMPGMPMVTREFGASADMTTLALTAAMLGNASLQWLLGPLADRFGRRRVLLGGHGGLRFVPPRGPVARFGLFRLRR